MEGETKKDSNTSRSYGLLIFLVIVLFLTSIIEGIVIFSNKDKNVDENVFTDPSLSIAGPSLSTPTPLYNLKKYQLNRNFMFPIEYQGSKIAEIKYFIKDFEFTKDVFVNYQKAIITNDKIVLAFNIELTNDNDIGVKIITGDYLRLSINNEDKLIAPEMNQDPVEVRPHATKETRVGFTISENDKNLLLQIGALNGEKDYIKIDDLIEN